MGQILIRGIDDAVLERLRLRAKQHGASLEQEARQILTQAAKVGRAEIAARAALLRAQQEPNASRAVDLIREDRDA